MKTRNIFITLEEAKKLYHSDNDIFKDIALQAFNVKELESTFKDIKTFEDVCKVLNIDYDYIVSINVVEEYSKASAAMLKLNIIRKALNLGQDLHLIENLENDFIYYPYNPVVKCDSTYYKSYIKDGDMEVIGKVKIKEEIYNILGGGVSGCGTTGLLCFDSDYGICLTKADVGLFGCTSKEIAKHFSKYFGMLITEAKCGDLKEFEIIDK